MDAASDKLDLAALPRSAAASADPAGPSPSAGTSKSPHQGLGCALPIPSAISLVRPRNCIANGKHLRNLRMFFKTDILDETTATTHHQVQMAIL